jgi:cytochrome c-type biogenesis protein CcmE
MAVSQSSGVEIDGNHQMRIRFSQLFTILIVAAAIVGVSVAFIANASPYVTVSEARKTRATNVHLKGALEKNSIQTDIDANTIRFQIKDAKGELMTVVYSGPPPQDINQATEIVAIGSMNGNEFHSEKLLIKCPSKYEGENTAKA